MDLYFTLAASFMRRPISASRAGTSGSDGSTALFESRSEVIVSISGGSGRIEVLPVSVL